MVLHDLLFYNITIYHTCTVKDYQFMIAKRLNVIAVLNVSGRDLNNGQLLYFVPYVIINIK